MNKKIRIVGINPAMITPFTEKGEVDIEGIVENVEFLTKSGVHGVVVNGCTGEAVSLTREERTKVIRTSVNAAKGKVKIIAGTGVPTTRQVIELTEDAKSAGADVVLVITPFLEIPSKEGLFKHYETLAKTVDIPIIVYNIPQHTGVEIDPQTLNKLAEIDNIVGVKDSSGNLSQFAEMIRLTGDKISVLSGSDDLLFQSFLMGASGAIIALGNIAPKMTVDLYNAVKDGDIEKAKGIYYKLLPVARGIGAPENFPAPVKEAVTMLGRPAGPCREPILPLSDKEKEELKSYLKIAGLLT